MTNTMTKKDYFNTAIDMMNGKEVNVTPEEMIAFFNHEISLLDKKATKAKTAPKKVDTLIDDVFGVLTSEPQTIDAIANALGISNAKATPRLNKLVEEHRAIKGTVKVEKAKKTTYALA